MFKRIRLLFRTGWTAGKKARHSYSRRNKPCDRDALLALFRDDLDALTLQAVARRRHPASRRIPPRAA
jgi:hypothetical protein